MFPTSPRSPARSGSPIPRRPAAAMLAAMLALAACETPTGGPADPLRPLPAARSATASATLATYTDRAAWEAAVAAAGATVQALDFAGMTLGRVTQLDTDYGAFRIVVDRLSASEFSNPGIAIFPDASCGLGTGDCDVFTFNVEDPAPLFPLNGPRVNQLVFPEPVAAFGGDFIQLGATAPTGTPTGPVTLQVGDATLVVNDYLDAAGNGFFGFVATAPATTLAFTFARSGTIGNDIFQVYNPAVAFGAAEPTPEEQIATLRATVAGLGLLPGMAPSLDSKLGVALAALAAGDTAGACTALQDLLNQLAAQSGKRIDAADAAMLAAAAAAIREELGC